MDSLASTSAIVSCTVTGRTTAALTGIRWYDSTGNTDLTGVSGYTLADGSLDGEVQVTTLTVTAGVSVDTTYKCEILGTKYDASIDVYCKLIQPIFFETKNILNPQLNFYQLLLRRLWLHWQIPVP